MKSDFLLRLCALDHFHQARAEPFGMSQFVAFLWNITEPRLREVREIDFWQPGDVRQRGTHHRTNHGPSCRYAVAREVIQQTRRADVVSPPGHFDQVVIKCKIETSPTEFQI